LHASVTLGVGQFCTKSRIGFCRCRRRLKHFCKKLEGLISTTPVGTMLTADLCANYQHGVEKFSRTAGVRRAASVAADKGAGKAQAGAACSSPMAKHF